MSDTGSSVYDILVFSFTDTHTADEVVNELKASQKLGGYNVVTVTLGDELSGTIAQSIEADITVTAPQASQAAVPAATEAATPVEAPKQ